MKLTTALLPALFLLSACGQTNQAPKKVDTNKTVETTKPEDTKKPDEVKPPAGDKVVIQYDCIPNYANWGGVTAKYKEVSGVTVPPDDKGSSVAKAALEKEKDAPVADVAYYSGAIGYAAAKEGLHQPYKPQGWDKIPEGLKDPEGLWFTLHTGAVAFVVNTKALGATPVPKSWADLLKPEYKGKVAYDDPTWGGTSYTMLYGVNRLMGGSDTDFKPGLEYLKKLDANIIKYPRESVYNDVLRGEIPIWINADGAGYKMKFVDKGDVQVVIPEEGSISMPLVMGMVKGAPHPEEAKKYMDWLLTPEAQALFAQAYFKPATAPLPPELAQNFLPDSDYSRVKNFDLAGMASVSEALKKAWLDEIGSAH
jgi:putative spermidine/putrescine transport system substrate-binding protein